MLLMMMMLMYYEYVGVVCRMVATVMQERRVFEERGCPRCRDQHTCSTNTTNMARTQTEGQTSM